MASCYRCGAKGSDFRRTVKTGFSVGNWVSKRSYGTSTRSHFGVRTVCEHCAISIDKSDLRTTIFFQLVGIGILLYFLFK